MTSATRGIVVEKIDINKRVSSVILMYDTKV